MFVVLISESFDFTTRLSKLQHAASSVVPAIAIRAGVTSVSILVAVLEMLQTYAALSA